MAEEPIIGPGLEPDEEVDVTLPAAGPAPDHPRRRPHGRAWPSAAGACRSWWCTASPPRGSSTPRRCRRLVDLGFKVIAVDTAGHGGTLGLPTGAQSLASYAELLGRVLDHLGVKRAVLAGHSMGGRLVTELAATQPERVIA